MKRAHRIALKPRPEQEVLFVQQAGYARFAYNWGVAEFKAGLDVGEWLSERTLRPRLEQGEGHDRAVGVGVVAERGQVRDY